MATRLASMSLPERQEAAYGTKACDPASTLAADKAEPTLGIDSYWMALVANRKVLDWTICIRTPFQNHLLSPRTKTKSF